MGKLSDNHKHLLRLVAKEQVNPSGWAKVSAPVYPLFSAMPAELIELRKNDDGSALVRTTPEGDNIVLAMEWL